jgi:N-methylhydantoinase A
MTKQFRLGIDVGGTFTDAVLISEATGEIQIAKVPSTPRDPSLGFLAAVTRILEKNNLEPRSISYLVHGTTVATNSLIEGKTPKTSFITTSGFRDMLEIARQVRPSLYDVHFKKPRPLVPRHLCFEVPERLDSSGKVLQALDENRVLEIAEQIRNEKVTSVAICFLHSYLNPDHEERTAKILLECNPQLILSISSRICPEFREYPRACTTIINACISPVVSRYLQGIERCLREKGMEAELLIMQSNGGVLTFEQAAERPVYMVESGPAAGVISASYIASQMGQSNVISFDMGGTTAKVGLILEGRPKITKDYEVGAEAKPGTGQARGSGYPIRTPVIDLVEIGAGGGSIAWVDSGGVLRVGPHSAGADPAPICYGLGGKDPTITDANVVLGRINPDYFLGGEMKLAVESAIDGIRQKCAGPLGLEVMEAANGIIEIANAAMINALRVVTVRRGYDPRDLVMVAFGGAGPLHANRLCAEMQIPLLIIPPSPGTASALGLLVTDLKHEFSRTWIMKDSSLGLKQINNIFESMEEEGRKTLARENVSEADMSFWREIEMRYSGQSYELGVECPNGTLQLESLLQTVRQFHIEHKKAYGHCSPGQTVELVNFRVTALGRIPKPKHHEVRSRALGVEEARKGTRPVFFPEAKAFSETVIYDRYKLAAGHRFRGPAIVEEIDSTSLIHPDFEVEVDPFGNLLVTPCKTLPDRLEASEEYSSSKR